MLRPLQRSNVLQREKEKNEERGKKFFLIIAKFFFFIIIPSPTQIFFLLLSDNLLRLCGVLKFLFSYKSLQKEDQLEKEREEKKFL